MCADLLHALLQPDLLRVAGMGRLFPFYGLQKTRMSVLTAVLTNALVSVPMMSGQAKVVTYGSHWLVRCAVIQLAIPFLGAGWRHLSAGEGA